MGLGPAPKGLMQPCFVAKSFCGAVSNFRVLNAFVFAAMSGLTRSLPRVLRLALLTSAAACSAPQAPTESLFGTGLLHPPPKPGDSISHTQMCECKACDPSGCCDGPDDDPPPRACGDSYDFSANDACGGLAVRSCEARCTRQVWRVHSGEACRTKRPASCCDAG